MYIYIYIFGEGEDGAGVACIYIYILVGTEAGWGLAFFSRCGGRIQRAAVREYGRDSMVYRSLHPQIYIRIYNSHRTTDTQSLRMSLGSVQAPRVIGRELDEVVFRAEPSVPNLKIRDRPGIWRSSGALAFLGDASNRQPADEVGSRGIAFEKDETELSFHNIKYLGLL
jgi:hypothetical protein